MVQLKAEGPSQRFSVSWIDENGTSKQICISPDLYVSLRERYTLNEKSFKTLLHAYLMARYKSIMNGPNPYFVHESFYKLCKAVANVSHELFADALDKSNVLDHFCSREKLDSQFGSAGAWESLEEKIEGGAGHPFFDQKSLNDILEAMGNGVISSKPYCRILILPFDEGSDTWKKIKDPIRGGEVIAIVQRAQLPLFWTHLLNILQYGESKFDPSEDAYPQCPVCICVWINEAYRRKYPPPIDTEECFMLWARRTFGTLSILDLDAIWRCFPDYSLCGREVSVLFQD